MYIYSDINLLEALMATRWKRKREKGRKGVKRRTESLGGGERRRRGRRKERGKETCGYLLKGARRKRTYIIRKACRKSKSRVLYFHVLAEFYGPFFSSLYIYTRQINNIWKSIFHKLAHIKYPLWSELLPESREKLVDSWISSSWFLTPPFSPIFCASPFMALISASKMLLKK